MSFTLFRPSRAGSPTRQEAAPVEREEKALGRAVPAWLGDVAQQGEHLLCKQGVAGSNPVISTSTLTTEQVERDLDVAEVSLDPRVAIPQ